MNQLKDAHDSVAAAKVKKFLGNEGWNKWLLVFLVLLFSIREQIMALGKIRRHYRMEALAVAAELIRQHGGTSAMDDLPEDEAEIFNQECLRLADRLDAKAIELGYSGHGDSQSKIYDIIKSLK